MKILAIDVDNPSGPSPGGQATYSHDYFLPLMAHAELTFLTLGDTPNSITDKAKYISVKRISKSRRLSFIYFAIAARRYVKSSGSEYSLILEQFTSPVGPLGLPRLTSTPVIGIAAFSFWDEMSRKYHLPFDRLANRALRDYENLVVLHSSAVQKVRRANANMRVLITRLEPRKLSIPFSPTVGATAVFLGRFDVHQKGLDLLIRALELTTVKDLRVRCVGFEESNPGWQRLRKRHTVTCDLLALGYLGGDDLDKVLQEARVLLAPSRYEGPSYTPLLGAIRGIPTVAFNLECFSEWENFMFLAEPFSPRSLALQIDRAYADNGAFQAAQEACMAISSADSSDSRRLFLDFALSVVSG